MKVLSQITIALNQLTIGKNQIKVAMNNTEVGLEKLVSITEFIEYDIPMTIFLAMPCSFFYKIKKNNNKLTESSTSEAMLYFLRILKKHYSALKMEK